MASLSTTCVGKFGTWLTQPNSQVTKRIEGKYLVSLGWAKSAGFPSLRTARRFQISCAAKPETVRKVVEIVKKQLALPEGSELTPETKFTELGADSLDTLQFFEEGGKEEVESFFQSTDSENISTSSSSVVPQTQSTTSSTTTASSKKRRKRSSKG